MPAFTRTRRSEAATLAAAIAACALAALPSPVRAQSVVRTEAPVEHVVLSVGSGNMLHLPRPISGMFIASDAVADVQIKSPTQLYVFGKAPGETTIYATDRSGGVVWSATVRVGNGLASVDAMLKLAMPEAHITATPIGGMVLLTGLVGSPKDIEEAQRLTETFTAGGQVLNRLRLATPLQVTLQVRIAEVSRDLVKSFGTNLLSQDTTGGFHFGLGRGNPGSFADKTFAVKPGLSALGVEGHLLGLDLLGTLDLGETDGSVVTLAEPNLTALSGETATFLAGGEIPIPISQGLGAVSVEYKQYGITLSFTPTVLSNGRIALRVKPEVSQLSSAGSVSSGGFTIPGLTTRRVETTVELGSGQSFMIGGLLNNNTNNTVDRTPGLGNLPILGALFRSNNFRRQQTELVVVVTPYLVKPVDASQIVLPTDGYRAPKDLDRIFNAPGARGADNVRRPMPTVAPAAAPPPPAQ
jgi:pilus assembly protein CpaC